MQRAAWVVGRRSRRLGGSLVRVGCGGHGTGIAAAAAAAAGAAGARSSPPNRSRSDDAGGGGYFSVGDFGRIESHRQMRAGFPEVVYAEGKSGAHVREILEGMMERFDGSAPVMASRVSQAMWEKDLRSLGGAVYHEAPKLVTYGKTDTRHAKKGTVAVLCAGTSDLPVAEEAATTLECCSVRVVRAYDVGVAGIHRLFSVLPSIQAASCVICVAGMDGALPSVVGGLVPCPVVAVPTSVGYGAAFGGLAPLLTMLNACAPGVSVVNIDNGLGAAASALKILHSQQSPHVAS